MQEEARIGGGGVTPPNGKNIPPNGKKKLPRQIIFCRGNKFFAAFCCSINLLPRQKMMNG